MLIDGRITSTDVIQVFGLGRQKVSALFTRYRVDYPENMYHDVKQKCYVVHDTFKAGLPSDSSPDDYLRAVNIVFGKSLD
nr:hypothetical protein [Vibrio mediterranei]